MTEQYISWLLSSSATRMILVEVLVNVNGVEVTRYLASHPYVTGPNDVPPNTEYLPVITGDPVFAEELSLTGEARMSGGEIELENRDGALDAWCFDVWKNGTYKVWSGDSSWSHDQFEPVLEGVVAGIAPSGDAALKITLGDKMERLNTPITEIKLGGVSPNKDALLPIPFGECHNVPLLLKNPGTLEYGFLGSVEWIKDVRTNGKPVPITVDNAAGNVTLTVNPLANTVTASVQGENGAGYVPRIAPLVQRIATAYGQESQRFTLADIDTDNFAAFDLAHPQTVSLWVADRISAAQAIQQLAASVGAQALISRANKLRLVKLALPAAGTPTDIGPEQMRVNTLKPTSWQDVVAAVKLAFDRNYTVQAGLVTGIPSEHADLYATEWLTETAVDEALAARYRLSIDPVQIETCLKNRADTHTEALRRLAMKAVPRGIYEFDGDPEMSILELGGPVTLRAPRYGMENGVPGTVVKLMRHLITCRVDVGVLA